MSLFFFWGVISTKKKKKNHLKTDFICMLEASLLLICTQTKAFKFKLFGIVDWTKIQLGPSGLLFDLLLLGLL